jgi:hypothetical protein
VEEYVLPLPIGGSKSMITLKSVDPVSMRYVTTGDWEWLPNGELKCSVAEYGNEDGEFLVNLHKMVEGWLCRKAGIREDEVSAFHISNPEAPHHKQNQTATDVEKIVCEAMSIDWEAHKEWVQRASDEVEEKSFHEVPSIIINGPRFWAELHLLGVRHRPGKNMTGWLNDWRDSIPFNGCPCKEHLDNWFSENPPDWNRFFEWGIDLHNAVNLRIGKSTMDIENAKELWMQKHF